jgi:Kef-type K+ transport system membrane component KefB
MQIVPLLQLSLLLVTTYGSGEVAERCLSCPALVAEIVVGMALGPNGLNIIPFHDGISALGQLGLLLIILEGGLHIELHTLRRVGWKAFAIALSGTTLPVALSLGVLQTLPPFSYKDALVAGTSLSSTAIGMAAKLMADMDLLSTHLGQLICCAAMIDDVASLILLAMISSAAGTNTDDHGGGKSDDLADWGPSGGSWGVAIPLISSLFFLFFSIIAAAAMPRAVRSLGLRMARCEEWWAERRQGGGTGKGGGVRGEKNALGDATLLLLLFAFAAALTTCAHAARTTALLGCFMSGVAFASVDGALEAWDRHAPSLTAWTSRLFFASIGFAVPVQELFSGAALAYGALLAAIAVGSKIVTGAWEWQSKWTVGWAMVGRGELGFVMAEEGYRTGLTTKLTFAVTVWALLIATLLSPIAFRRALAAGPSPDLEERVEGSGADGNDRGITNARTDRDLDAALRSRASGASSLLVDHFADEESESRL